GKGVWFGSALAAVRRVAGEGVARPRGGGRREDLRLLLLERRGLVEARTAALNQLQAVPVSAPERLRVRLGSLRGTRLARAAQALRAGSDEERVLVRSEEHTSELQS